MTDLVVVPKEVIDDAIRQLSWFRGRALKDGKLPQADWIEAFRNKLQWCVLSAVASAPPVGEGVREKVEAVVRRAVSRARASEVDPVRSFNINWRLSERDHAVTEAADAILALLSSGEA